MKEELDEWTYEISDIHDAVLGDVGAVDAESELNLLLLQTLSTQQLLLVDAARFVGGSAGSLLDGFLGSWLGSNSLVWLLSLGLSNWSSSSGSWLGSRCWGSSSLSGSGLSWCSLSWGSLLGGFLGSWRSGGLLHLLGGGCWGSGLLSFNLSLRHGSSSSWSSGLSGSWLRLSFSSLGWLLNLSLGSGGLWLLSLSGGFRLIKMIRSRLKIN